jgi:hypothetical protein
MVPLGGLCSQANHHKKPKVTSDSYSTIGHSRVYKFASWNTQHLFLRNSSITGTNFVQPKSKPFTKRGFPTPKQHNCQPPRLFQQHGGSHNEQHLHRGRTHAEHRHGARRNYRRPHQINQQSTGPPPQRHGNDAGLFETQFGWRLRRKTRCVKT